MKIFSKSFIACSLAIILVCLMTLKARDVSVGILKDWDAAWARCPAACQKRGGWRGFWACYSSYKPGNRRNEFIFTPYACTCECAA